MVVLSQIEEQELLKDYDKIVWRLVHRYSDGNGSSRFTQEDLYQECMLVLLKHMNKCETKEELRSIQVMDLVNAMTRFVLRNQAVKLDANRTSEFKTIMGNCARNVNLTEAESEALQGGDPYDTVVENVAFEQFLDRVDLRDLDKEVLGLLRDGYRVKEVARMVGRSHQVVSYAVKRAKRKYESFVS